MHPELHRQWQQLFGREYQTVVEHSFLRRPTTLRVNTLTWTVPDFLSAADSYGWDVFPQAFSPVAFRIRTNRRSHDERFSCLIKSGWIYGQDLASQLPAIALGPQPGEFVADIAAAPGSKTTQMAVMMEDEGGIVAVDSNEKRFARLQRVVEQNGITNVDACHADGAKLGDVCPDTFHRVMVDVPCSCEGIFRYRPHTVLNWTPSLAKELAPVQRDLLISGFKALKPGGTLLYSTCTYAPEENEAVVNHLLERNDRALVVPMSFDGVATREGMTSYGDMSFDESLRQTVRIYPQDNDSIGFYIAKVLKD